MTTIPKTFEGIPAGYSADLPAAEIERRFKSLLGPFETPSVPLNLTVTEEVELAGSVVRQRLEYDIAPGGRVAAYHLFRKGLPAGTPGVLSIHGHGGNDIFPVGKAFHCHPDAKDPVQYSYRAALKGFRVLAPDALCFGERQARWGYSTLFFGWGAKDEGTPEPMYRAFCDAVRRRDTSALTVHEDPDRGHEITLPMLDAAMRFLEENL